MRATGGLTVAGNHRGHVPRLHGNAPRVGQAQPS